MRNTWVIHYVPNSRSTPRQSRVAESLEQGLGIRLAQDVRGNSKAVLFRFGEPIHVFPVLQGPILKHLRFACCSDVENYPQEFRLVD